MGANDWNDLGRGPDEPRAEADASNSGASDRGPLWRPDPAPEEPRSPWTAETTSYPGRPALASSPLPPAPPAQPWVPAYPSWAPSPAFGAPYANTPRQEGIGRHLAPLIMAVALLSASLSAVGTYAAVQLTARPAAAEPASTGQAVAAEQVTLTQSDAIVRVANLVKPSVVTIETSAASTGLPFSDQSSGVGSGFIVSADGLILTNNHVVSGASSLTVILDDARQFSATVVTTDATHDLALIKVDATGLTPVTLGDSSAIQVGQLAIAIGSPLGTFTDSVTQGIVSGTDRSITVGDPATRSEEDLSGLIQTDAAINPGNSGGPLLDASGSVIGIVVASASSAQDMGFAIPIDQARSFVAAAGK